MCYKLKHASKVYVNNNKKSTQRTFSTIDPFRLYVFMCKNVVDNRQIFTFHSMQSSSALSHFHSHSLFFCKHFGASISIRLMYFHILFLFSFVSALMAMHNYWGLFQSTDEHLSVENEAESISTECNNSKWRMKTI